MGLVFFFYINFGLQDAVFRKKKFFFLNGRDMA